MPKKNDLPPAPESTASRKNFNTFRYNKRHLLRCIHHFILEFMEPIDDTLNRTVASDIVLTQQFVVQPLLVQEVIRQSHNTMGHPVERLHVYPSSVVDFLPWNNEWYRVVDPEENYAYNGRLLAISVPWTNIVTTQSLELVHVCVDCLQLEK